MLDFIFNLYKTESLSSSDISSCDSFDLDSEGSIISFGSFTIYSFILASQPLNATFIFYNQTFK